MDAENKRRVLKSVTARETGGDPWERRLDGGGVVENVELSLTLRAIWADSPRA